MATKIFSRIWPLEFETISEFIHQIEKLYIYIYLYNIFQATCPKCIDLWFFFVCESGWQGSTYPC
jgi:hypothetical protein